jgi:hypothetical protein
MPTFLVLFVAALIIIVCQLPARAAKPPRAPTPEARKPATPQPPTPTPTPAPSEKPALNLLSREEIVKRLNLLDEMAEENLQKEPPPIAMCYAVGPDLGMPHGSPKPADYLCPVCRSKTTYASADSLDELENTRRAFRALSGVRARLDETEFCKKCSNGDQGRRIYLEFELPGDAQKRRIEIRSYELQLLNGFFAGQLMPSDVVGEEAKQRADTIHRLIGEVK